MKRTILFLTFLLSITLTFAQYSDPYRMAFDGSNYYVTNQGNGTISKLDTGFNHSTIITGLHEPNDIFFGALAGNSVIMVIDSNEVKLFDSTSYASLLTIPITGATEAHDGIFNPNNSNEFFITDRAGNQIIKGSIGSAPFYPITFTTFVSSITKPAGIIANSAGKLIVVSDTVDAEIYEINPSTGAVSTVKTTSLDNLNDIAQDNEGNYYTSCWGDSKLYRYSSTWTNETAVKTFNHPSGLFSNLQADFIGVCCTNCQKVEFIYYHLHTPLSDITTCQGDSFFVDFSPTFNGIGTYSAGNQFVVEMSDSNGNFSSAIDIGKVSTSTRPSSLKAAVPAGTYADSGYSYRVVSTNPVTESYYSKNITMLPQPNARFANGDTIYGCINETITLEQEHVAGNQYAFFPPIGIQANNNVFTFSSATDDTYNYWFQVTNSINGCTAGQLFVIIISDDLILPGLADSIDVCEGIPTNIHHSSPPYKYIWQGSSDIDDSTSASPLFSGTTSTLMTVALSDSSNTCFGADSVYISIRSNINLNLPDYEGCIGDTISVGVYDSTNNYSWSGGQFMDSTISNPLVICDSTSMLMVMVSDNDSICSQLDTAILIVNPLPDVEITLQHLSYCYGDTVSFINENALGYDFSYSTTNNLTILVNTPDSSIYIADSADSYFYQVQITDPITGCFKELGNQYDVHPEVETPIIIEGFGDIHLQKHYGGTYKWIYHDLMLGVDTFIVTDTNSITIEDVYYSDEIRVVAVDVNGCESDTSERYILIREGVEEFSLNVAISPNPNNGTFRVVSKTPMSSYRIYSSNGQLLEEKSLMSEMDITIETDNAKGMLIIEIYSEEGIARKKVFVE